MVWGKIKTKKVNGEVPNTQVPIIMSASISADVPAFYADWVFKSLEIGYPHGLINILNFLWEPLIASGMTSPGIACYKLANTISTNDDNQECTIVLLSDGCSTDDYEEGIGRLHEHPCFNNANKFAIAYSINSDINSLVKFVDDDDHIFVEKMQICYLMR